MQYKFIRKSMAIIVSLSMVLGTSTIPILAEEIQPDTQQHELELLETYTASPRAETFDRGGALEPVLKEDASVPDSLPYVQVMPNEASILPRVDPVVKPTVGAIYYHKYTGLPITPEVVVKQGTETLVKDTHYTIAYENNKNVGEATATVSFLGELASFPPEVRKFDIEPVALTISGGAVQTREYDGSILADVDEIFFDGLVNGETLTYANDDYSMTHSKYENKDVGKNKPVVEGTVSLAKTGVASNYTLSNGELKGKGLTGTITKKQVTVTPVAGKKAYGEQDPVLAYKVAPPLIPGDYLPGSLIRAPGEDPLTYSISQDLLKGGNNYDIINFDTKVVFTIEKADVLLDLSIAPNEVCAGEEISLTVTAKSAVTNPIQFTSQPTEPTLSVNGTKITLNKGDVGTYTATYTVPDPLDASTRTLEFIANLGEGDYYKGKTVNKSVMPVPKRAVTITGLVAPERIYNGEAVQNSDFGKPILNPVVEEVVLEYNYYTASNQPLSEAPKAAGDYILEVKIPTSNQAYTGSQRVNFTIGKAPLQVQAEDTKMYQYQDIPVLTALKYTGFVNGDNEDVLTGVTFKLSLDNAVDGKTAGTYPISVTIQGDATNYEISEYRPKGQLTVIRGDGASSSATEELVPNATKPTVGIPLDSKPDGISSIDQLALVVYEEFIEKDKVAAEESVAGKQEFANKKIYDIVLLNKANDTCIQPKGVITICVPYPVGTDAKDTFSIIHLVGGTKPEVVTLEKIPEGLKFSVTSLSPFVIGWVKATAPGNGGTTGGGGTGGGGGSNYSYYTIQIGKEGRGTILPDGGEDKKVTVRERKDQTFTFVPEEGYEVTAVVVDGKPVDERESYTFKAVSKSHTLQVSFAAIEGHIPVVPDEQLPSQGSMAFEDVTPADWFYEVICRAVEKGWLVGVSKTKFDPYRAMTRGMMATVLWRMEESPDQITPADFGDVTSESWYAEGVTWAQREGIVEGYGNGEFGPKNSITREQMVAIFYRYAQYKGYDVSQTASLTGVTDSEMISDYASIPMAWAVANGIIVGKENGVLDPKASATRAEVAAMLSRLERLFY